MNRQLNLNLITEKENFFNNQLERNRIMSNSPKKNNKFFPERTFKSPTSLNGNIFFEKNNFVLTSGNLGHMYLKLKQEKNNFNENKTQYPIIDKKPLLTDSNFDFNGLHDKICISSNFPGKSQKNSYKKKEGKNNLNFILTNANSNKLTDNPSNEKNNFINKKNLSIKTENECKNRLFNYNENSTKNINKTNRFNFDLINRNIYSSYNYNLTTNNNNAFNHGNNLKSIENLNELNYFKNFYGKYPKEEKSK